MSLTGDVTLPVDEIHCNVFADFAVFVDLLHANEFLKLVFVFPKMSGTF